MRLQALDDDLLASGQALLDHDAGAGLAAGLDAPDRSLAVLDHEHIDALLIRDQRGLGDHDLFLGRAGFDDHPHELAVDQRAIRIGHGGADRMVSVVRSTVTSTKLMLPSGRRSVPSEAEPDLDVRAFDLGPALLARRNSRWLTGNVTYIGSWLTMVVSTPLSGPTTLPLVMLVRPILPPIGAMMSV